MVISDDFQKRTAEIQCLKSAVAFPLDQKRVEVLEKKMEDMKREDLFGDLKKEIGAIYHCNQCGKELPIKNEDGEKGIRFHCMECFDYDLCEACFAKKTHRHYMWKDTVEHPDDVKLEIRTQKSTAIVLNSALVRFAERPFLGWRKQIESHVYEKEYSWLTCKEVHRLALAFGSGLARLLEPRSLVAIIAPNSHYWAIADIGCLLYGFVPVPVLNTLRDEQIESIVSQCIPSAVICCQQKLSVASALQKSLKMIAPILLPQEPVLAAQNEQDVSDAFTFDEICNMGEVQIEPIRPNQPEDLTTIIYTSGSTGSLPKGAAVHDSMWWDLITANLGNFDPIVTICKDPLVHISERELLQNTLVNGGRMGFTTEPDRVFEDIKSLGPIRVDSTPRFVSQALRFWNIIYGEYKKAVALEEAIICAKETRDYITQEERYRIKNKLMPEFSTMLGNRVIELGLGGAVSGPDMKQFLKDCFAHCKIIEGYGLSETGSVANDAGTILTGVEWKLVDVPQLGYTSQDIPYPRGELLVKTKHMIRSYYNNTEETSAALDDGWFRTGDVVELIGPRQIKIVDRVKNFFKLSQGEFVSPEPVENVYLQSPYIDQIVITHADLSKYQQTSVIAVVVPRLSMALEWWRAQASQSSTEEPSLAQLCQLEALKSFVCQELVRIGRKKGLRTFEIPYDIILDSISWTVENGLRTSSAKLCRPALRMHYKAKVDSIYSIGTSDKAQEKVNREVNDLLAEVLNIPSRSTLSNVEKGSSLVNLGADSLSAIKLTHLIYERFNVKLDAEQMYSMTVEGLSQLVSGQYSATAPPTMTQEDWEIECQLEGFVRPQSFAVEAGKQSAVLITGATGFVGVHILAELLKHTTAQVWCLIRGKGEIVRVQSALQEALLWESLQEEEKGRIRVVFGDLGSKRLGISEDDWANLSNTIDTIYHCGAIVNHVFPYQDLKHVNVDSTKEILALACSGKQLKRIHYMSTASVFSPKYHRGRDLTEHTPLMLQELPDLGGYAQSKWVSERLCKEAFDRGVPVTIYRIGMASWSTKTGFSNYRDWFDRLLFGMLCLPGAPVSSAVLNLIPVNFVAEIIVKLANTVSASKDFEIFHLSHSSPVPFTELVKGLIALNVDEQCQDISEEVRDEIKSHQKALAKNQTHKEWVKSLIAAIQEASETGNAPRANVLSSLLLFDSGIPDDSRWRFSVEHTKKRLDSHLWCPTIEPKDIGTLAIQLAKRLQGSL